MVLRELHNEMGHQGVDRTVSLIRDRFFWPNLKRDVEHHVTHACSCLKQKKPSRETRAPLTSITTTQPFELVSIDFLHIDRCSGGYEYVLVVIDHFTRFAQAYATTSKSAKTVADKIFGDYALKFGFPMRIHHVQGGEFENQLFAQLKRNCGVLSSRTTSYHPQGNGQVEHFNRTLLQMLKALTEREKSNWKNLLNKLVYAYNCTRSEVTGFSPFFLLYGRPPRLPSDLLFRLTPESGTSDHQEYMRRWKSGMQEAYEVTQENAKKSAERGKRNHDKKSRSSVLQEGDRVLVRNLTPRGGTGKLRNHWEDRIHKVVRQVNKDLPIYEVVPELGKGRESRILHRNLLLPCDYLPLEIQLKTASSRRKVGARANTEGKEEIQAEVDSDEDDYGYCYIPKTQPHDGVNTECESRPTAYEPTVNAENPVTGSENELPQSEAQDGDCTLDQDIELEKSAQEGLPVQQESILGKDTSLPLSTAVNDNYGEHQHQRPRRERRAPKLFTYDQLGNPVCYCALLSESDTHPQLLLPEDLVCTMREYMDSTQFYPPPRHYWPVLLHGEELEELEDKGMSELLNLKDKILELHAKSEVQTMESVGQLDMLPSTEPQNVEQSEQASEQSKLIKQIEEMQFQLSSIQRQTETKRTNKEQQRNTNSSMLPRNTVQPQAFSSWPKEFKIAGQVGEPGQKDRLTFSSLARQIEHGLNKGFPELEIVDAVIRAIAPGMQLRSYLEGKANLTLPILHRILCSHYQERSATELYKQLTSEVQGIKETPQAFLIRALDLRQKILFALQESESGLKYDPGLVQNLFLHAVLTGLQNDNIKRDLQPYLEQSDISDELLLERLNIACAYEAERQNKRKMTAPQRSVAVHSAHSDVTSVEDKERVTQPKQCKIHSEVLSELKEVKSGMALLKELRAEVSQIKESMQQPVYPPKLHLAPMEGPSQKTQKLPQVYYPSTILDWQKDVVHQHTGATGQQHFTPQYPFSMPRRSHRRGCFQCQQRGAEANCMHCFKCGSDEHFMLL
ncbi:hypothetical protein SRHO_G00006810 [Serrasalmus rhombeus]